MRFYSLLFSYRLPNHNSLFFRFVFNSQVFAGNTDYNGVVRNSLSTEVQARYVRFYPVEYEGGYGSRIWAWPCLRVEVYVQE